MAIVNRDILNSINKVYNLEFTLELENLGFGALMDALVWQTQSNRRREDYAWMLSYVRMREWLGEREFTDEQLFEYFIKNRLYEATIRTEVQDIEDGTYRLRSQSEIGLLAEAYRDKVDEEIYRLLDGGFTDDGPDGVKFYAADHPVGRMVQTRVNGSETYTYDPTGTMDNFTTAVLSETSLWQAREDFQLMTDHLGRPAVSLPDTLVVGPKLEKLALELVTTRSVIELQGSGATESAVLKPNPTAGMFKLIVEARLGTSLHWFLFSTGRKLKPFIFQNRVSPQFQQIGTGSNPAEGVIDSTVFMTDAVHHGVRARFGVGYGVPSLAYGSDGTV